MFNKKLVLSTTIAGLAGLFIASNASAVVNGPYLGLEAGAGNIHQTGLHGDDSGYNIAGRILAGYQFNPNVAIEIGASKYADFNSSISAYGMKVNGEIETYTADVAAKGIVPLQDGFSLYGKIGGVYVNEKATVTFGSASGNDTEHKILPEIGVGVSYDINPNVVADISWTHVQKTGNNDIQNLDFGAIGISYHFG